MCCCVGWRESRPSPWLLGQFCQGNFGKLRQRFQKPPMLRFGFRWAIVQQNYNRQRINVQRQFLYQFREAGSIQRASLNHEQERLSVRMRFLCQAWTQSSSSACRADLRNSGSSARVKSFSGIAKSRTVPEQRQRVNASGTSSSNSLSNSRTCRRDSGWFASKPKNAVPDGCPHQIRNVCAKGSAFAAVVDPPPADRANDFGCQPRLAHPRVS